MWNRIAKIESSQNGTGSPNLKSAHSNTVQFSSIYHGLKILNELILNALNLESAQPVMD